MKCGVRGAVAIGAMILSGACVGLTPVRGQSDTKPRDLPTPKSVIGHEVGADYKLARWETIVDYFGRLGVASPRVNVRQLDTSTEGAPYLLAEISSAETLRDLDTYRALQAQLADPALIPKDAADARSATAHLLARAKTTILVSCGLHSNECAASQMAMELAYELASRDDPRMREILDNCIILLVPSANPDGNNKIVDWYERYLDTPYEGGPMPWLYQKYAGHDDNRDWFMLNLKETRILTKLLYHEWFPTILYDIHQMGNRGARFFVPPFFDPVNPNVDPLIHQSLLIVGGHMATELQEQGKTGVVFQAIFDNWWAGGNRTTPYRHNIVGILTESASAKMASPIFQDYRDLQGGGRGFPEYAPAVNFAEPWPGGWWRLRDIVEYQKSACLSLFTLGARYRDHFVKNHLMLSEKALRLGQTEPPFAWLVPPNQRDPGATATMLETLRLGGIRVHAADAPFVADGREYAAGTHVMLTAQPFRPHLMDMMERQQYPDRRRYEGGPAESPYDAAGWTLPLQMGVTVVEAVAPFEANLRLVDAIDRQGSYPKEAAGDVIMVTRRAGNSDYAAINALLADGFALSVMTKAHEGFPPGSIVVQVGADTGSVSDRVAALTRTVPARFERLSSMPDAATLSKLTRPRTALYQPWTSNMDEGWTRLVLEQFGFPYATIHNAEVRAGRLRDRFDCIIMPDQSLDRMLNGVSDKFMPPPYAGGIGPDGAMALERFVEDGGTLVLMDSATQLATELFRVPVRDVLLDLPRDEFFCPGSLLRIRIDPSHPVAYGFDREGTGNFSRSQAFVIGEPALRPVPPTKRNASGATKTASPKSLRTLSNAEIKNKLDSMPVTSVASYSDNILLQSGWILGEDHVRGRTAVAEVGYGKGRIVLFGFRVQFRGQPHGTYKFLFNSIYRSTLEK